MNTVPGEKMGESTEAARELTASEQCLEKLGLGALIGTSLDYRKSNGETGSVDASDLETVCGEHTKKAFQMLLLLDEANPDHKRYFDSVRVIIEKHFILPADFVMPQSEL